MANKHASNPLARGSGFTLLESMVAVTLLGTIMLAVVAALSASQQVAFEGQKRILAAIACDDRMSELCTLTYTDLQLQDGVVEDLGELQSLDGAAYPTSFWSIGRTTTVESTTMTDDESGASVQGLLVTVSGIDEDDYSVVQVQLFVPDPSVGPSDDDDDEGDDEEGEDEGLDKKELDEGGGLLGGLLGG